VIEVDADDIYYAPEGFTVTATADGAGANAKVTVYTNYIIPGGFTIQKMVELYNYENIPGGTEYVPAGEGFFFSSYEGIDDGVPYGYIETVETDEFGRAVFGPSVLYELGKEYYVFEEMTEEQTHIWKFGPQGPFVVVTATADGASEDADPVEFENNYAFGTLTVEKFVQITEAHHFTRTGEITGGFDPNVRHIAGSDWMRPYYIDLDAILGGTPFVGELVAGDLLAVAGTYTITALPNGDLLVELSFLGGVDANTWTTVIFGNANVDVPVIATFNDGDENNFNNNTGLYWAAAGGTITIPADDVLDFATGNLNSQYFFLHTGIVPQTIIIDISDGFYDIEFGFTVRENRTGITFDPFVLKHGESKTFTELVPGRFAVSETSLYTTIETVMVVAAHDTHVLVENIRVMDYYDYDDWA